MRGTPFAVACITYTNAAVGEIDARVAAHLMPDDQINYVVSTIHSFCLHHILRPFASRVAGFSNTMKVLTAERTDFVEIADKAAELVGRYDLQFTDYERFSRIGLGANGELIGSALEDDMIRLAAPHFLEMCAARGFIDFASILYHTLCLPAAERRRSCAVCRNQVPIVPRRRISGHHRDSSRDPAPHTRTRSLSVFSRGRPGAVDLWLCGRKARAYRPVRRRDRSQTGSVAVLEFPVQQAYRRTGGATFPENAGDDQRGQEQGLHRTPSLDRNCRDFRCNYRRVSSRH